INYVLSQPGVSTVVPGVKNERQLEKTLHFLEANDAEMDFTSVITEFQEDLKGNCVYCNHCLPCPAEIDIGRTIRMLDKALQDVDTYKAIREKINFYYPGRIRSTRIISKDHSVNASACTECGVCMERCPFEVDIISKMKQAEQILKR
ncbi:4Fe-4S dicluster domain-containing protein, partial [candidate division WOR-3 bacterium]|nr:4Fe-4S dicluster domain-containing protein [candidate division WOR-3 bacterium]